MVTESSGIKGNVSRQVRTQVMVLDRDYCHTVIRSWLTAGRFNANHARICARTFAFLLNHDIRLDREGKYELLELLNEVGVTSDAGISRVLGMKAGSLSNWRQELRRQGRCA